MTKLAFGVLSNCKIWTVTNFNPLVFIIWDLPRSQLIGHWLLHPSVAPQLRDWCVSLICRLWRTILYLSRSGLWRHLPLHSQATGLRERPAPLVHCLVTLTRTSFDNTPNLLSRSRVSIPRAA